MNITKIIIIFLLIIAIIILNNKKNIYEHFISRESTIIYISLMNKNIKNTILLINNLKQRMYLPNSKSDIYDQNLIWSSSNLNQYKNNGFEAIGGTLDTNFDINKWNNMYIYKLSNAYNQTDGIGIEITVPQYNYEITSITNGYSVLWIKLLFDRLSIFKVYKKNNDNTYTYFGKFASGYTKKNNISPDGTINTDEEWYPVPIKLNSDRKIIISVPYNRDAVINPLDTWFASFAFSTNFWNHCKISGKTLYLNLNDNDTSTTFNKFTNMTEISGEGVKINNTTTTTTTITTTTFRIPFVNNNHDKIFYLVEINRNFQIGIINVSINNVIIGNLYSSFDNPFATHFNTGYQNRYLGIVIPKANLPLNDNFITITLNIPNNNDGLYIREIGTHDLNPFN